MPSSTSSSERPVPGGSWSATWLVALALAAMAVAWLEHVTRAHGQHTTVTDDPVTWSVLRHTIDDDPHVVAFLGASRMALAYSADAFAEAAPDLRGVQLAINGVSPFGVLADLADDEHFRGVAVLDIFERDVGAPDAFTIAREYVERSHALWRAPGALANRMLGSLVQSRLAVLAVGGRQLLRALLGHRRWPPPMWVVADRHRVNRGYYTLAEPAALARQRDNLVAWVPAATPTPDEWLGTIARDVEPLIARIRAHGGDVVVLHMPITGALGEAYDRKYPRAAYWDVFAARSAAHVLHFRDIPALAGLECAEGMHLDQKDQAAFTRGLVDALRARGIFAGR